MVITQFSVGPSIGSTAIRSIVSSASERFVFVQYLPINRQLSDTEYKSSLRSVQLVIQLIRPRLILSLDDDYLKFMPQKVIDEYKDKFIIAYKGISRPGTPSCGLIAKIAERSYNRSAPMYIIRDDNVAHIEASQALGQCLRDNNHEVRYYSASTLADLKSSLFNINTQPQGFLISLVNTVSDTEFNTTVGLNAINRIIHKINKTNLDIGFVRASDNLSVVIIPSLDNLSDDERLTSIRTDPHMYVSIDRLDALNSSLVYKNMFHEIDGVLDE